jgi:2-methylisocitrate lyase-like PEP mutase family enzyme
MGASQTSKAGRFRALHEGPEPLVIPNPWDAGTARLLTRLGFEALTTTSAGLAFSLGRPDGFGRVSRAETLANVRVIVEATDLPVAADLENGFGDSPEEVAETIRLAAEAGLVGASIEDATGDPARPLYGLQQAVERVAAAAAAARRLPFPFMLVGRAENFRFGKRDLDDTIERLQAYAAAGADVLFAPGLARAEDIRTVCQAVDRPVNVVMGLNDCRLSVADLAELGVRRISVGASLYRAALGEFERAAREIMDPGTFAFADKALPYDALNALMGEGGPD